MEQNCLLVPYGDREYEVTRRGWEFLAHWHIDKEAVRNTRRAFARRCLDWTEKRHHLAGALGAAICDKFLDLRWITRAKGTRIVYLSPSGRRELAHFLSLKHS